MGIKFHTLQPWLEEILNSIRKDIKTDYLPGSGAFYRAHFGNRPQNRLTAEEINGAFIKELLAGNEEMAAWVVNHWVFKHGQIYNFFEDRLRKIRPDFGAIEALTEEESARVLQGGKESLGAKSIYLFSVLNDVVFPNPVLERLRAEALAEGAALEAEETAENQQADLAKVIEKLQRELARQTEKYEQKVAGVLKKYTTDTEALKKQVRSLQQKIAEKA